MKQLRKWLRDRRSAVTIIFALSLVPLVGLIGLATDYTFVSLDRTKAEFAAQAAATHALRAAASTYALEIGEKISPQTASTDAQLAGNTAGNLWFNAQVGLTNRDTITLTNANGIVTAPTGTTSANGTQTAAPTFTATVQASLTYPPFFNSLFKASAPWVLPVTATAQTTFSYAQILLMLDTSNSMLIGANESDIITMQDQSMCPKLGYMNPSLDPTTNDYNTPGLVAIDVGGGLYETQAADGDAINFSDPLVTNSYIPGPTPGDSGTCNSNYGLNSPIYWNGGKSGQTAGEPCALACHTTANKAAAPNTDNNFGDSYCMERRSVVNLIIDVMLQATENVIQDMTTAQAIANQLTVGVYQFNADTIPIAEGTSSDTFPEATSNLTAALAKVEADDITQPTGAGETEIPVLMNKGEPKNLTANPPTLPEGSDSNFYLSMLHLLNGTTTGTALSSAGNSGTTVTTPQKFMFIITDGIDDEISSNGGFFPNFSMVSGRDYVGEMTSQTAEQNGTGICAQYKAKGYTIYVLYVTYYPVASQAYYNTSLNLYYANPFTTADYPSDTSLVTIQNMTNEPTNLTSPTALALKACASSPSDFYPATSSADIKNALSAILKSALASTIRLTN